MTQIPCSSATFHARQRDADRARAGANRRHFEQLLRLTALSRRGRLSAPRAMASERTALDMIWRQHQRYRRLELFLERAAER